ncbi:MAG: hypothetical protein KGI54_17345 [Pseudomonadota bacterium]|nr:hypothetical protein [Pseudomonadota bacterium]
MITTKEEAQRLANTHQRLINNSPVVIVTADGQILHGTDYNQVASRGTGKLFLIKGTAPKETTKKDTK